MKLRLILGVLVLGSVLFISSCDDDEVPTSVISFESEEQEVTESDGTPKSLHPEINEDAEVRSVPIKLVFDRPLAKDAVLKFDIDGTARATTSSSGELNDFELIEGDNYTISDDEITIKSGAAEVNINVRIIEDFSLEWEDEDNFTDDGIPFETVEFTIESVISGPIKLEKQITHTIKILEDDAIVFLQWNPADQADSPAPEGDVNLDLYIYFNSKIFNWSDETTGDLEGALIPAGINNGTLGLSYVYKGGTSNNVEFISEVINFGGNLTKTDGTSAAVFDFTGIYKLANLNATFTRPSETATVPESRFIHKMTKSGLNYTNLSELAIPATGSRAITDNVRRLDLNALKKVRLASPDKNILRNFSGK